MCIETDRQATLTWAEWRSVAPYTNAAAITNELLTHIVWPLINHPFTFKNYNNIIHVSALLNHLLLPDSGHVQQAEHYRQG